jgi:NAD-dependent deacetylase
MGKIAVLTGAGISAESGIKTFRDADGLWEGHDVMEVATPDAWRKNRKLVLDFYNQRRRQLHEVEPNAGHLSLVELENYYDVAIITQNVDNLHERAGSKKIIHLHGELMKALSEYDESYVVDWTDDIIEGDLCPSGHQMRPHIVWFGEMVPMMEIAAMELHDSDIVIIIGTSMQVYPAAGLVSYAQPNTHIYYIDPKPAVSHEITRFKHHRIIAESATKGVPKLIGELVDKVKQ